MTAKGSLTPVRLEKDSERLQLRLGGSCLELRQGSHIERSRRAQQRRDVTLILALAEPKARQSVDRAARQFSRAQDNEATGLEIRQHAMREIEAVATRVAERDDTGRCGLGEQTRRSSTTDGCAPTISERRRDGQRITRPLKLTGIRAGRSCLAALLASPKAAVVPSMEVDASQMGPQLNAKSLCAWGRKTG